MNYKKISFKIFFLLVLFFGLFAPTENTWAAPLTVHPANPRYFTDGSGKAIFLTGLHTWANLKDVNGTNPPPTFDWSGYLNQLKSYDMNFIRLWAIDLPKYGGFEGSYCGTITHYSDSNMYPWKRSGGGTATDGKPKFNLTDWNDNYFNRLSARIAEAQTKGIYVSIMLFEGFGIQWCRRSDDGYPFSAANNINSISDGYTSGRIGTEASTLADPAITAIQKAYIKKVVDTVNSFDNVLYEISNETGSYSTAWQTEMISYLKSYQLAKSKQHPIGMTYQYSGGKDSTLLGSQANWVSLAEGSKEIWVDPANAPTKASGTKVVILDTDHLSYWSIKGPWFWRAFTRGYNIITMEEGVNYSTAPFPEQRNNCKYIRSYAKKIDLANMLPSETISSTKFALAKIGQEYLVYQPTNSTTVKTLFTVNLPAGAYTYEWFNPSSGDIAGTGSLTVTTAGNQNFQPTFYGDSVLYLKKNTAPSAPTGVKVI